MTYSIPLAEAGQSVNIFNPFGGNIYIEIQKTGISRGLTKLDFTNVLFSPFFARTQSLNTTCNRIPSEIGSSVYGPWFDMMTDESLLQIPSSSMQSFSCNQLIELAETWQERMNDLSKLMGYRELRNRYVLHSQIDTTLKHGHGGIGKWQ